MKKGLALPINTMVALAIAVVVLLAMVAFFMGVISTPGRQQTSAATFRSCCEGYVLSGCSGIPSTHACGTNDAGDAVNLAQLAAEAGIYGDDQIKSGCGCIETGGLNPLDPIIDNSGGSGGSSVQSKWSASIETCESEQGWYFADDSLCSGTKPSDSSVCCSTG